ncbi:MAG TPA: hydrogenase formation protein HypD [Treponema sp.]|nr:hydrogenase formation protein HypD [Treponema sp.]
MADCVKDGAAAAAEKILKSYSGRPLRIMEVCGTHTHEIFRLGIRNILPENIRLISGPGCPVCVTPTGFIDEAVMLALDHGCTIATFGDLVRVPGTEMSLAGARSKGAHIEVVYSPLDSVVYAGTHPGEQVVFLSVGFETTTPAACISVRQAKQKGLGNYSLLTANKTMDNAYAALKDSADAFLYPGHVSVITGTKIYERLRDEGVSGVVTGFTAGEILAALAVVVTEIQKGGPFFRNCYPRVVTDEGNVNALKLMKDTMIPVDAEWRGIGTIPQSGLTLNDSYAAFDARKKYALPKITGKPDPACRCGDVLRGECSPDGCACFGTACTPEHPVGACMVSGEGACAAYYKYGPGLALSADKENMNI